MAGWVNERLINLKQPYISIVYPATKTGTVQLFFGGPAPRMLESHSGHHGAVCAQGGGAERLGVPAGGAGAAARVCQRWRAVQSVPK